MNTVLHVKIELLSDTIFGSGYSIPGAEDIAVCQDEKGFPYLKGSTFKGLMRESLENLLAWSGGSPETAVCLLGESGRDGLQQERRLFFTDFLLEAAPQTAEDCYDLRAFTSLENGIVKAQTLRTASCIRSGLAFTGSIYCDKRDTALLRQAFGGIKWAGTMRSRGFGRVRVTGREENAERSAVLLPACRCIRYRLHTEQPVQITNLSHSAGNQFETRAFLPGSAVRGMVMSWLSSQRPEWFQAHKAALLGEGTRFLDAVPAPQGKTSLPAIQGFYEDKKESRLEKNVVISGEVASTVKRAKLGNFCALEGDTLCYWSAATGGAMRLNRRAQEDEHSDTQVDSQVFSTRYLSAGQDFEGYILLEQPELAPAIAEAFGAEIFLGADRYAGFGRCSVALFEAAEAPAWQRDYAYPDGEKAGCEIYLLAVSPFSMLDEAGAPCGLCLNTLAEKLGAGEVKVLYCATSLVEYGGYNRTWQSRLPAVRLYDRGSIFHLRCDRPPDMAMLRALQEQGLGIRREEGFGQILFLPPCRLEQIQRKKLLVHGKPAGSEREARLRRARYRWVMEKSERLRDFRLSKSQLGGIQALCVKAIQTGNTQELLSHLEKNLQDRGARHGARFLEIAQLVRDVLKTPLAETLGEGGEDSTRLRLELLCLLFDHSRKSGEVK